MSEIGGDLAAMQGMVASFQNQKAAVEGILAAINQQMSSSPAIWKGPRAERFRAQWPEFQAQLRNLEMSLEECAQEVQNSIQGLQVVGG
jgi:WXG100 family type VII secretion target